MAKGVCACQEGGTAMQGARTKAEGVTVDAISPCPSTTARGVATTLGLAF